MGQTKRLHQMFVLNICMLFFVVTRVSSQSNACTTTDSTIVITFPELNPPQVPSPTDGAYTQNVLTNGEPYHVNVNFDPGDRSITWMYPFSDYFRGGWNPIRRAYTVTMIKGIDRDGNTSSTEDDVNLLQYQLECFPDSSNAAVYKVLKIQIWDVNDNTPIFVKPPYVVNVNELTPVGVTVYRAISATDLDEGPNRQIYYSFSNGISQFNFNGTSYFDLPIEQEGIVSVKAPLDFESMYRLTGDASLTYYTITVTARDNAPLQFSQRTTQTTLKVLILDGDDQGPEFVYPSCISSSQPNSKSCIRPKYLASISSGNSSEITLDLKPDPPDSSDPTSTVLMLMQDRDTLNSSVTCRISRTVPSGYESYFTASSLFYTGKQYKCVLKKRAGQTFNRASVNSLEIIVEAIEQSANLRVDYATVVVSILSANLNLPVITYNSNTGYIYENSPVGSRAYIDLTANTTLLKLTFTDPDRSQSDPQALFDITVSSGHPLSITQDGYVVVNNCVLDYETTKQYIFTVTITKQTTPRYSASTTLTINVLDVNDNSPVISTPDSYIVSVPQGDYTTARTLVIVQATDVDFGLLQYRLSRVVPLNATYKFSVSLNGTVSLIGSLKSGEIFTVYVTASDRGSPVRSTDAVVIVSVPQATTACKPTPRKYVIYVSEEDTISATVFIPVNGQPLPWP